MESRIRYVLAGDATSSNDDWPGKPENERSLLAVTRHRPSGAHTENRLDVSAYRCVDVAGRNRQNCTASIFPVVTGCHPACAITNATISIWFSLSQRTLTPRPAGRDGRASNASPVTAMRFGDQHRGIEPSLMWRPTDAARKRPRALRSAPCPLDCR